MKIAELLKLPSCSVWPRHSEQQRRSLFGKVHRADHAGQIRHMDLASSEGGLEMENNQYSDILTNAMSGDMLVVPMVYGSHFWRSDANVSGHTVYTTREQDSRLW